MRGDDDVIVVVSIVVSILRVVVLVVVGVVVALRVELRTRDVERRLLERHDDDDKKGRSM